MTWHCATCGSEHTDLPLDWHYDAPAYWDGPRGEHDELTDDLCLWTDDGGSECFFIRGLLPLPVLGAEATFNYGVWSSLSEASFRHVLRTWDDPSRTGESHFGWLSNAIADFPATLSLPLDVVTGEPGIRPRFILHDGDHPLVAAQRRGVTLDWVRDVAARHLHAD
ncbi:MAG TPA: DUF2199 domain-containing protein [Gaiellaceae bacterium]|nr:DUF2199 domain-containing protein [Gaiellaceae bacterium]